MKLTKKTKQQGARARAATVRLTPEQIVQAHVANEANLLASIGDAVVASDEQYRITAWNAAAEAMYEWKAAEVLGRPGLEIMCTEWAGADLDEMRRTIAEAGCWRGEATQQRKDGTRFPVEMVARVFCDERGQITGYLCVNRDITKRKRAEEALRKSQEQYRAILQTAMDGYWLVDAIGRLLDVNERYCQMSGYTRQELLTMAIPDLEAGEDSSAIAAHIEKVVTMGEDRFESLHRRKDGSVFDVEISVRYEPIDGGRFVVFLRDITERRRAEEALRKSEEQHRTILQTAMDGFWLADTTGRLLDVNERYCQMSGYTRQELLTMAIPDLEASEDPSAIGAHMEEIVIKGENRFDTLHRRKDGSAYGVESSVRYDPNGGKYFVAFLRDITERKRTEQSLKQSHDELEQRVHERTADLNILVNSMAGREVRMLELKGVIKQLRAQLEAAGLQPVVDDSLAERTDK